MDIESLLRKAAPLAAGVVASPAHGPYPPTDKRTSDERIERWRHRAARNDDELFAARLAWDGLTLATAAQAVCGERALRPDDEWWAFATRRLVQHLEKSRPTEPAAALPAEPESPPVPDASISFAPVLAPLLSLAAGNVERACSWASLPGPVRKQLLNSLCRRLSNVSHRALGVEFRRFRDALARRSGCWSAFVEQMRGGGLLEVLERLPVLARLLATVIQFWGEDTSEFLNRLASDQAEIARFLGGDPGEVVKIECSLSDPHRGGRSVKIVRFTSGARVVYKPRSLDTDRAWFQWMEWLRRQEPRFDLLTPRVLDRSSWGWVEFIAHEPCKDAEAVARFYWRAGCLLCLLHVTSSDDFHDENLLAHGEYPVPIDLETIFKPEPRPADSLSDATLPYRTSVLFVGLLPGWREFEGQNDAVELSGLGSTPQTQPILTLRCWIHPNSDEMEFAEFHERRQAGRNRPFLREGTCPDAGEFVDEIVAGFCAAYNFLIAHRTALLAVEGPLETFRNCRSRIVYRPTEVYGRIWERSINAACLASGVDRSLEFEGLSRHYLSSEERHGTRAMFRAEAAALEQLDVPLFEANVGSGELVDANGDRLETNGLIPVPSFEGVVRRIKELSSEDCDFQIGLIRASFAARERGSLEAPSPAAAEKPREAIRGIASPVSEDDWRAAAREMADSLRRQAIWSGEDACWVGLESLPISRRVNVKILGSSLYGGSPGLAVFFAARFALEGDAEDRRAALGITHFVRRGFLTASQDKPGDQQAARAWLVSDGIGAATGGGSTIYALLMTGQLLKDSGPIETAIALSRLMDKQAIRTDRHNDVIAGGAGAILALLALWRETREPVLMEKALLCGEQLLRSRVSRNGTPRAWKTVAQRPLAGFSHGAAGIGLALLRLHQAAPDVRFLDAALEGFAYERTLFSAEAGNWADLRDGFENRVDFGGWCHGAPGIALARMAALEIHDDPLLRSDLDCALRFLTRSEIGSNATLCCGEIGKADILLEAGRRLGRPELISLAHERASAVAAGREPSSAGLPIPGMFQGTAGLGYGLLRQVAPDRLPSILLWN
jgi:type 2 lantibiotic biosynthesis protein LanM